MYAKARAWAIAAYVSSSTLRSSARMRVDSSGVTVIPWASAMERSVAVIVAAKGTSIQGPIEPLTIVTSEVGTFLIKLPGALCSSATQPKDGERAKGRGLRGMTTLVRFHLLSIQFLQIGYASRPM